MPRRKSPAHSYSVYITSWASAEIKESESQVSSADQLETRTLYRGGVERTAAWHFYRGAQEAMHNPLVISVKMRRDGAEYIRLVP